MTKEELLEVMGNYKSEILQKQAEAKTASEAKAAELKAEIEKMETARKAMQEQLDAISTEQAKSAKAGKETKQAMTLEDGIRDLLASDEFKAAKADKFKSGKVFSIKADTTNITGSVNMTQQAYKVNFAPENQLGFLPYLNTGTIGQDKNRVLWVEGAYTTNVGYVSEGTGSASADTATAQEKTREMAKISAKLPLTQELLEDAEYIASALRMKMQEKAMLFTDKEFYSGAGVDSTHPKWIYGIVSQSTAYAGTAAGTVVKPNIGDLIDAVIMEAEVANQRGLNVVWMNPVDFMKFKTAKDANGQYLFVKDVNGTYTINGMQVIRHNEVTANTMTVANTSKIQAWWKRNPEIKFSNVNGTDFVDDAYTAVMFLRCQCVIETPDKTAVIHVSDVEAAIVALEKATA